MGLVVRKSLFQRCSVAGDGIRGLPLANQNRNISKLSLSEFGAIDPFTLVVVLVDPEVWKLSRHYPMRSCA